MLCTREHMRVKRLREMRIGKVMRLALTHQNDLFDLLEMSFIDSAYREGADFSDEQIEHVYRDQLVRQALSAADEINGDMLLAEGYEQGPKIGEILFQRRVERFKWRQISMIKKTPLT